MSPEHLPKSRCHLRSADSLSAAVPGAARLAAGFSPRVGFIWGVLFPWGCALPLLYMPDVLAQVVNFTSLVFVSFTDFIVPFCLFVNLQRRNRLQISSPRAGLLANEGHLQQGASEVSWTSPLAGRRGLPSNDDRPDHLALPARCGPAGVNVRTKVSLSVVLGVTLTALSACATYLTIDHGTYTFDSQVCALVCS